MSLWVALKATQGRHWKDATIWVLFTLVGTLIPFGGGWLLLLILGQKPSFADFSNHGEFSLYSASMFASSFYILGRDFGKHHFPGRWLFVLLGVPGIIAATLFYTAVTTALAAPVAFSGVDLPFQRKFTFGLFAFSTVVAFILNALESQRLTPAFEQLVKEEKLNFEERFEKLGGGQ